MTSRAGPEAYSKLVLTVGHSTRTFEEFLSLLRAHGVRRLVATAPLPHSPRRPHFDQEALWKRLPCEGGIGYRLLPPWGPQEPPS